jgi:hypothetical protein
MNRRQQNIFALIINFLTLDWKPHHVFVSLFEANDTTRLGLAKQLKVLLESFSLTSKVLCFVKDERLNLRTMGTTLKSLISCEVLNLKFHFDSACFGHAMSKATQYDTNDDKISMDLKPISVKSSQLPSNFTSFD